MGLFTTHSAANRVIHQGLATYWTRERFREEDARYESYVYNRIRTKSYSYVGMTKAAAGNCVNSMVSLWNRPINPQIFDAEGGQFPRYKHEFGTDVTSYESTYAEIFSDQYDELDRIMAASINLSCEVGIWSVNIDVNETLSFKVYARPNRSTYWESNFMRNPNMVTAAFRGWMMSSSTYSDFTYDE